MVDHRHMSGAQELAAEIIAVIESLPMQNTPSMRAVRRRYSRQLQSADARLVLAVARRLVRSQKYRWIAYELVKSHKGAFLSIGASELEELGKGINSWESVDSFARTLSGPAWRDRLVGDTLIRKWARSPDRWWRRAALVSTVALNVRSQGGRGDTRRTLAVCRLLLTDHDDMVVKAMSWALRELAPHDPDAVRRFIDEHERVLAARVKREVRNKLTTGLKKPRRSTN